ncbi:MAG TPA: hypothetical protein VNX28_14250, partial [Gemmataceae bacterium]|nr:hypothetical protein [Gemmataceae bacterium]
MFLRHSQAFILAIGVILTGLGTGSVLAQGQTNGQPSVGKSQDNKIDSENLLLKTLVVKDSHLNNQQAFSLLIPSDWKGEGGIIWRWHAFLPATGTMKAWNPNGVEAVRFYGNIPFVDGIRESAAQNAAIAGPQAMQFAASRFPEGGNYAGNEVRRIAGKPADYLTQILLPRQRPDIKGYKIIAVQDMPKWAQPSSYMSERLPGMNCTAQAGRVRIEYVENGRTIHEDFFLLLPRLQMGPLVLGGAESASSVRGEAGKVDALHKLHNTMLFSTKIDLNWFNQEQQVAAILQDMANRQQQQVMEVSQIFQRTRNEISKMVNDSYKKRQETQDRLQYNFSQIIRGVQSYTVPGSTSPVELPSGYDHVWANNLGQYILSNRSNFN